MYQKHSQDLVICKDNRSTQSAHKCRGGDSPQKLYQNLTHKNSNQSKDIHLLQNNQMRPTHYLQTSIDVHELNRSQKARHSHQRIKTEIDRSMDLNKRIYPKVLSIRSKSQETIRMLQRRFQQVRLIDSEQLNQIKEVQRDIQDSHHKYFFQPDIKPQLSIKANNYLKINPQANFQDSTLDDLSQIHHQQNKLNDIRRNTNPNQLKKSLFQQIQDFNLIRFEYGKSKEEDYMKFSFGFQYNQVRSTKKFPKDVFYNDVRKAKKNLSMQ